MSKNYFKAWVYSLLLGSIITGCGKKNEVPEDLLSESQMISLMLDIYVAEGKINKALPKRDSAEMVFALYENKIFEKHSISDSSYKRSLKYYYDHPDLLLPIFETVLDSLNSWDKQFDELAKRKGEEEQAKQDSLTSASRKRISIDAADQEDESNENEEE